MKNIRTPRSLSESSFTTGYAEKQFPRPHSVHPSTWVVILLGLIGLGLVIYTR